MTWLAGRWRCTSGLGHGRRVGVAAGRCGRRAPVRWGWWIWRRSGALIAAHERLSERGDAKLRGLLRAGDPHGEVRLAWHANQTLRGLYDIDCPQLIGANLGGLADDLTNADCLPELRRLGRTLARWHTPIVNWHHARVSNGPTEAVNNLIQRASNAPPSDSAASRTTAFERSSTPANPTGRSSPASLPAEIRRALKRPARRSDATPIALANIGAPSKASRLGGLSITDSSGASTPPKDPQPPHPMSPRRA